MGLGPLRYRGDPTHGAHAGIWSGERTRSRTRGYRGAHRYGGYAIYGGKLWTNGTGLS